MFSEASKRKKEKKKKSKALCHHCVSDWVQTRVHLPGCRPPPQWKPHGDQESWLVPGLEVPPARKCLQTQQDIIMPKTPLVILKLLLNTYTFKNETCQGKQQQQQFPLKIT